MARLTNLKLKASTLPEALAAMVIILACFGICTGIYYNVLQSDNTLLNYRTHVYLMSLAEETKQKDLFVNDLISLKELDIRKTVESYPGGGDLFELTLSASTKDGRFIENYRELIRKTVQ
jgi:hypothetical protein